MSIEIKFARVARVGWVCLLLLLPALSRAENLRVSVVLSDSAPPYQTLANTLKSSLINTAQISVFEEKYFLIGGVPQPDLVVAIGMKAMQSAVAGNSTPVLGVMIPRQGYELLRQRRSKDISAIYLDQTYSRQMDFLQAILPNANKIAVLHSPGMDAIVASLKSAITVRGMSLRALPVESAETLYQTLESGLDEVDVLLAVPDSTIYNNNSVRNILLTSYRHRVPLIGISQAYVNAGALGAIFSTPEQLAEQTVETITAFGKVRQLADPQYPTSFSISFNQQVARSLGIPLIAPEAIRERMNKNRVGDK